MDIILNARTEKKLTALRLNFPQALLLTGERGVGLATLAKKLAGKEMAALIEPVDSKGNVSHDTGTISVEIIRTLYEQTRSRTSSRQVVIIDDADRMSLGAQAAFLKLLEEPTENTYFILTSHSIQALLPTVQSRAQVLLVEPISGTQTTGLLDSLGVHDTKTRKQLEYLALGLPAEVNRLNGDPVYFKERAEVMGDTRTFLTGSTFEKLLIIHKYYQDRARSIQLIDSSLMVSRRSINQKPNSHLIFQLDKLLYIRERVEGNCNIRLQLTNFVTG